ncbi:MAG: glycerol-3-phosphate dehydrogenase [Alphaproteobacteria bacterium]|jgi:glycerol-3-phosphate dehydrogenase subunit C|nr:glycerol-3-phosphate dehydrogenase [Alphaproteobacteria bacterium]
MRHPIDWTHPDYLNPEKLDEEVRRVFDICHGCRRCFNLCDTFPRLFDLVDESPTGELDSVKSEDFAPVVEACTLCDLCFASKCPYIPPHEFNLDFPHLMLRYRALELSQGKVPFTKKVMAKTDQTGAIGTIVSPLANWATKEGNALTRPLMEKTLGIHRDAALPKFQSSTLVRQTKDPLPLNTSAAAYGRKVAIYATCYGNYNDPKIGLATRKVLAHNGVETQVVYPGCCGMPLLEQGNLEAVAKAARNVAKEMRPWIDQGYEVIALVPSCALMLKSEWPLIVPDDENVQVLSKATRDISEYMVALSKEPGLEPGLKPLTEGVTVHIACHARAQNIGQKATDLLRLIPDIDLQVIERCSGHGGAWGVMAENFDIALKVGKPVAQSALKSENRLVLSECPLAATHIRQGMEKLDERAVVEEAHPIEIFARAYGL